MEVLMNERLDAMQSAIDAFIATISTSTLVATPGPERVLPNLLAADERLQAALVLLSGHQANVRALAQRTTVLESLRAAHSSALHALATLRADLLAIALPASAPVARSVPHAELLAFARAASVYSPRAGGRPAAAASAADEGEDEVEAEKDSDNPGLAGLTGPERAWLNPLAALPHVPWPADEAIMRSALAREQGLNLGEEEMNAAGDGMSGRDESVGLGDGGGVEVEQKGQNGNGVRRLSVVVVGQGREMQREEPREEVFGMEDLYDD